MYLTQTATSSGRGISRGLRSSSSQARCRRGCNRRVSLLSTTINSATGHALRYIKKKVRRKRKRKRKKKKKREIESKSRGYGQGGMLVLVLVLVLVVREGVVL